MPVDGGKFVPLAESKNASDVVLSDSRLVYLDTRQIFSVPLEGGEPTTLAIDVIENLTYSNDRKVAVFEHAYADGKTPVVAVDTDGKTAERPVVAASATGARLMPDGRHVVFSSAAGELAVVAISDSKAPQPLGRGYVDNVLFSPSGKHLAFYDSAVERVVVAQPGGAVRQLGDAAPDELRPLAFSDDESALVAGPASDFLEGNLLLLAVEGGGSTVVSEGKRCLGASFSAKGTLLTLQAADSASSPELWLTVRGENMMLGNVERCDSSGGDSRAVLSPDKAKAVFVDVSGKLVIVDLDSGKRLVETKKLVAVGSTCFALPTWSSDGSTLLMSACKDGSSDCAVFTVDAKTGKPGATLGTGRAEAAEFSPDARYVVYVDSIGDAQLSSVGGQSIAKGYWGPTHWLDAGHFAYSVSFSSHELHLLTLD
jgi:WD40 repeat protein